MSTPTLERQYLEIPLGLVDAPELPSRAQMDEHKLDELAADIRRRGLLQPIGVFRHGERFEVVYGDRRSRAAKLAGLVVIPAFVYASKDSALEGAKWSENYHREDLNPADEGVWFHELLERDCGGDVDRLCDQLGVKRPYAEKRLALVLGDVEVLRAVQREQIKVGCAEQLNRCTDEQMRRYYLDSAIRGGATVAVVTGWIMDWQRSQAAAGGSATAPAESAAPSAVAQTDYFRCVCCDGTDNVHLMIPVNVHQHCKLAILDKLLASYKGQG